jgi:hypothetical protein
VTLQYQKKISRVDQSSTRVKIEGIKILDLINGVYIYWKTSSKVISNTRLSRPKRDRGTIRNQDWTGLNESNPFLGNKPQGLPMLYETNCYTYRTRGVDGTLLY